MLAATPATSASDTSPATSDTATTPAIPVSMLAATTALVRPAALITAPCPPPLPHGPSQLPHYLLGRRRLRRRRDSVSSATKIDTFSLTLR